MAKFTVSDVIRAYKEKGLIAQTGLVNVFPSKVSGVFKSFGNKVSFPCCALGALSLGLPVPEGCENELRAAIFQKMFDIDYWKFTNGFDLGEDGKHPDTVLGKACREAVLADPEIPKQGRLAKAVP